MNHIVGWMVMLSLAAVPVAFGQKVDMESANMRLVGHSDLNGNGNGGEGLALTQYSDGRRILFLAHESAPLCFSVVDVTNPAVPKVATQIPIVSTDVRCNSLVLSGRTLYVAHQTLKVGLPNAGMRIYDVSDPGKPTELAFFDTTGPHSRGVHYISLVDDQYVYMSTGSKDFTPAHPNDDQFLMIVDIKDPRKPREAGRWWLPGMREGDAAAPLPRLKIDNGYRLHSLFIDPKHSTRAYAGWIDGGVLILDLSERTKPKLLARHSWYPPDPGFAHTALALPDRNLIVASEESTQDKCADWPKRIWVIDIRDEIKPKSVTTLPTPENLDQLCQRGGRFGAHNIQPNRPGPYSRILTQTVVAALFNGGVRVYSIADPAHPQQLGYFVPTTPPKNPPGTIQMNDLYVDENGLIYANDRFTGGLYILEYTGTVPLR
jgi:hypothetical protein